MTNINNLEELLSNLNKLSDEELKTELGLINEALENFLKNEDITKENKEQLTEILNSLKEVAN